MTRYFASLVGLAGLTGLVAGGCAEPAFSAHLRDNALEDVKRALAAGKDVPAGPKSGAATAYLMTGDKGERHLVRFDLEAGRVAWDVAADVTSRVAVGRGFVAHREGKSRIVVRSSDSGQARCAIDLKADEQFVGISADSRLYWVTMSTRENERVSTLAAANDSCGIQWRDEASMSIGAPAARGDVVAVPYAFQNVVFIDGKTGAELARVRATDESVSFVRATPEGIFYGDNNGIYLFNERGFDDPKTAGSKKGSAYTEARLASAQLRKFYFWDGYQTSQADYTAFDRNRLLWRAEPKGDTVAFRDDAAFLHSFRYIFAFDSASGTIRWAYAHPKVDLVGSDHTGSSIVYASADGEFGAIDAKSGAPSWSVKSGLKVTGATFDADGFVGKPGDAPPLMKTLGDIVSDPDQRFTAVKVFAVSSMATMKGTEATAELVRVVTKDGVSPAVSKAAGEALIARKDADAKAVYHEALGQHADYLADLRPHGADVLAKVEAAVEDKESVPLIAAHLADPATPLAALKEIVRALIQLGGTDSVQALRNMLLTYRSDAAFKEDPLALQLAADGLLKLGGPDGRRVVIFVAEEPRTMPALATYIRKALADDEKARAEARKAAEAAAPAAAPAGPAASAGDAKGKGGKAAKKGAAAPKAKSGKTK